MAELYRQCWQVGTGSTGEYEKRLADALEAVFSAGHHALDAVVAALNASGVGPPGGGAWTAEGFAAELRRRGA
ncbi:MAG: recombinase-like helix-turn-helix domain-containing protein [Alphaproteobacteria bacterium]